MSAKQAPPIAKPKLESNDTSLKEKGRWQFAFNAFWTTLGGGALTLVVALTQAWYGDHLEQTRRQAELGLQYQEKLFEVTGAIETEFSRVVTNIRRNNLHDAKVTLDGPLANRIEEWQSSRFLIRNRGAYIYGYTIANFIYEPSERVFSLDNCNVVVRLDDPTQNTNCAVRRRAELSYLSGFLRRIVRSADFSPFRNEGRSPKSFQVHLDVLDRLVRRYIGCVTSPPTSQQPQARAALARCGNLEVTRKIINARFDLLVTARSNLADAILERSVLER